MFQNLMQALHNPMENRPFNVQLRCYSAPFYQGADARKVDELNFGGKILLPPSALDWLVRLNIQYPMMFKLSNPDPESQRVTHCGVLEFLAEEGRCYLPGWMMRQLLLEEGSVVQVEYVNLPVATYAKFQPMNKHFLEISNPRVVLEIELRKFSCLTKNDCFAVQYNDRVLEFKVKELRPQNAVTITECDMNVEFDAPDGYVEPNYKAQAQPAPERRAAVAPAPPAPKQMMAFSGSGQRLDGKTKSAAKSTEKSGTSQAQPTLVPDYDYRPGHLNFVRHYRRHDKTEEHNGDKDGAPNVVPFSGGGRTLRDRR